MSGGRCGFTVRRRSTADPPAADRQQLASGPAKAQGLDPAGLDAQRFVSRVATPGSHHAVAGYRQDTPRIDGRRPAVTEPRCRPIVDQPGDLLLAAVALAGSPYAVTASRGQGWAVMSGRPVSNGPTH